MAEELYEAYDGASIESMVQRRTPGLSTEELVDKLMMLGQVIAGVKPYPYQIPFIRRCFEAVLEREAEEITSLMSRQSGKSFSLAFVAATLMVMMPELSKQFPDDDRFNFYDRKSDSYRNYSSGFWCAIYAPKREQATIIFNRVRTFLRNPQTIALLQELGLSFDTNNGDTFRLSSGSFIKCSTASDQANIEGMTLHLAILEESQDISDEKANKSIGPMLAAVGGTLVKIGTANAKKSHFYNAIRRNERRHNQGGVQNNFTITWEEAAKYNSFYEKFVRKEVSRLGLHSDEFQMNYACFDPATLVSLANGGVKPIGDLEVGELVLTHTGAVAPVVGTVLRKSATRQIGIEIVGSPDIVWLTADHRVWTDRGWVQAGDLTDDDLLPQPVRKGGFSRAFPIRHSFGPKPQVRVKQRACCAYPTDTYEAGALLGWYLAEGSGNKRVPSVISFSLNYKDPDEVQEVCRLVRTVLRVEPRIYHTRTSTVVAVSCSLGRAFRSWCGDDCYTKRVPSWAFSASTAFREGLLNAYFAGDGSYHAATRARCASTVSRSLATGIHRMLTDLGHAFSLRSATPADWSIEGRSGKSATLYTVGRKGDDGMPLRLAAPISRRIRALHSRSGGRPVVDIQVGHEDESFQLPFMAAHNCRFLLERGLAIPERLFWNRTVTEGTFSDILPAPRRGMHYCAGIDFGKLHDSTVVTIMEVNWENPRQIIEGYDNEKGAFTVELYGKHVVDWLELQGDDYEAQYVEIQRFLRRWGIAKMALDYTGVGAALGDRFKAMFDTVDVEFVTYSDDSKDALGREMLADLHNGMVTWPGGAACDERREYRNFKSQMLDLEKDYRNGLLSLHHPDIRGAHDDYPQSLCLAVHACNTRPFGGEVEESPGVYGRR